MLRPVSAAALSTLVVAALSGCALLGPTEADVAELQLLEGDCIENLAQFDAVPEEGGEVGKLPVVDCAQEHEAEVYYSQDSDRAEFSDDLVSEAEQVCYDEFTRFVGLPYDESRLYIFHMYPTEATWGAGDRQISCLIAGEEGEMFTGSLEDSRQ